MIFIKMTLNTDSLQQLYSGEIPEEMQSQIECMQELSNKNGIKSVTLLRNFGKDMEMSMKYDTDIFRGLIVQTDSEYKLSEYDRLWMHPEICKGRSMYTDGQEVSSEFDIGKFNSSVGIYSTHSVDDIGGYKKETYTIVDSGMEEEAEVLLNNWVLSESSMKNIYEEIVGSKLVKMAQEKRDSIAKIHHAKERKFTSNYNMLYSDGRSYFFYNHAIKPVQAKALLHVSPLIGCAEIVSNQKHIESDLLSTNTFINMNELTEEQRLRAYESCTWEGQNVVNTYTMRRPLEQYKQLLENYNATMYRLEKGFFSANPVHDKLPADILLYLTPHKDLIPTSVECQPHIRNGFIDLPASQENIQQVMTHYWRELIDEKHLLGDSLLLKREMVENLLD